MMLGKAGRKAGFLYAQPAFFRGQGIGFENFGKINSSEWFLYVKMLYFCSPIFENVNN